MSHHYSGPDYGFPNGDSRLDLTDLYAFPKPGEAGKSIFVMNVHPSAGVNPQGPTTAVPFAPGAIYELMVDTNGDAVADFSFRIRFSSNDAGVQTAIVNRVEGATISEQGDDGRRIIEGAAVSMGSQAFVTEAGEYRFFAGWRSDPYFFDTLGALNNFQFTGVDFFAEKDVCSIVLEVSNSVLGSDKVLLWHRTLSRIDGRWAQADRGALPSQSVFLTGEAKAEYLAEEPVNDKSFVAAFAHSLEHTGGYARQEAERVANSLLPDVLRFDPNQPATYPDNGRSLSDDVMDHFISIITNGRVTRDNVGPHTDLLTVFPYLAPPHTVRSFEEVAASAPRGILRREVFR